MAGKLGMKGGGGFRVGAGRPKSAPILLDIELTNDPLAFLRSVMLNDNADIKIRAAAAIALLPYVHAKQNDTAKAKKNEAAKKASAGKYASVLPPMRLVT